VESTKHKVRGILAVWNDCRAGSEVDYETWYRGEHLPERVSIPGFRAAWRFRAVEDGPEYFTFYETDTPEVLFSQAYLARLNNPTPLTRRIMSSGIFTNATRALLTSVARWGTLRGAFAVSVRFDAQPDNSLESRLGELAARDRVLRTELWVPTRADASQGLSAEQRLRPPDKSVAAAALIETLSEQEAQAVAVTVRDALGVGPHVGVYRLFCGLGRGDLDL